MPGGDYRDALRERAGWRPEPGPLLDVDGERVGEHGGSAGYTVGQRQGLGVALGEPRYVSRIDPLTNTIQLGRREDLETTHVRARAGDASSAGDAPGRGRSGPRSGSATARRRSAATRRRPLGDRRWTGRDRRAGLGGGARSGGRAVRRRRRPRRRADRTRPRCARRDRPAASRSRSLVGSGVSLDPALILAVLVGIFHAALYVLIRGSAGGRLPLIVGAAILGAWAGDALGDRLGHHARSRSATSGSRRVGRGVGRDRDRVVVAVLGPTERRDVSGTSRRPPSSCAG